MQSILVPTDFSEQAGYALEVAHDIAKKNKASLKLLNIIEAPGGSSFNSMGDVTVPDPMDNVFMMEMLSQMKRRIKDVATDPRFNDIYISTEVTVGNPFNSIAREITTSKVDLVVMGSKGASGFEETIIGSNTEKVVRRAKCPVLTVKSTTDINSFKNIAFASDFRGNDDNVMDGLKQFQKLFDAKLHLVKVNTPNSFSSDRELKQRMQEFAKRHALENFTLNIYNEAVEEDGIIYFADEVNADVIAMATHGRTGLMRLLSGSIAEDVVNHAKRPVWTCRILD